MKKYLPLALAGLVGATMIAPSLAGATTTSNVAYDSTPVKGTVSVPSVGAESSAFDQIGNEVLLRPHSTIGHVKVTMVSFACQSGQLDDRLHDHARCHVQGTDHAQPVPLQQEQPHDRRDQAGSADHKPSPRRSRSATGPRRSAPASPATWAGRRTAQRDRADDLVPGQPPPRQRRGVDGRLQHEHQRAASARRIACPMDSLNVGLSPATRIGHDRFPDSIMWDTRAADQAHGARRSCLVSSTWTRVGPATCRLRASPFADENLPDRGGSAGHGCPALMSQATTTHVLR